MSRVRPTSFETTSGPVPVPVPVPAPVPASNKTEKKAC